MNQVDELMRLADAYANDYAASCMGGSAGDENRKAFRTALEAALKPGEPVAWIIDWPNEPDLGHYFSEEKTDAGRCRPLYTAPPAQTPAYINQAEAESHGYLSQPVTIRNPAQTPVPPRLTDEQRAEIYDKAQGLYVAKAIRLTESAVRKQAGWE